MRNRVNRIHPALKHGAYSATAVLPGESRAAFEKLHRGLIAEFIPSGVLEDDIVMDMARLVWRKQNLGTLRIAERAQTQLVGYCPTIGEADCLIYVFVRSKLSEEEKEIMQEEMLSCTGPAQERARRHLQVGRNWRRRHIRWLTKRIRDQRTFGCCYR